MKKTYEGFIIKPKLQWGEIHTFSNGFPVFYLDREDAETAWLNRGGNMRQIEILKVKFTLEEA